LILIFLYSCNNTWKERTDGWMDIFRLL